VVVLHFDRRFLFGCLSALIALTLYFVLTSAPAYAHAGHDDGQHHTAAAPATCESAGFVTAGVDGGCTHGPDPAPLGVNPADVDPPTDFSAASFAICDGDGQSGERVQVIYARASDKPDRYNEYVESFRGWASEGDAIYQESARETSGMRYIRFVHDANCRISVRNVVISPSGDQDFWTLTGELWNQGFHDANRKYLIFFDRNHPDFCGQATTHLDSSPGTFNTNNQTYGYAVIYNGCWSSNVTISHELGHTFGAVQRDAPNASRWDHCVDEWDVMCYDDGSGPGYELEFRCPEHSHNERLDCNHDDYFHTNPSAGAYLATHWNIADSDFLGTSGSQLTLSTEKSKFNGWVGATLSGFAPNQQLTLSWPDLTVLARTTTDGTGRATVSFRTPLAALGTYTVLARDTANNSATALLRVIPRINLNETAAYPGTVVRVYFYGFAPDERVEVQWFASAGAEPEVLGVARIAENGRGTVLVTIPLLAEPGPHTIRGDVIGVRRSTSMTFTVIQTPWQISLSTEKSKYNGTVGATLTGFTPNAAFTVYWPDGLVLGQGIVDGAGNATLSFRTPLYPLGTYEIRAIDSAGRAATNTLRIIPRIKLTEDSGPGGTVIRVYLYGFAPGNQVDIKWYALDGASYTVLSTVTIADNGRASRLVTIPEDAPVGEHRIQGDVIGIRRSTSDTFSVTPTISVEPSATPTATATATAEPTETSTPVPSGTATPEPSVTTTPVPTETSTPEPTGTAPPTETPAPTETPSPVPSETASPEPTATETPVSAPQTLVDRKLVIRGAWREV
jgi:hypothetical protein